MASKKMTYGACIVCGKGIVYQGSRYCSPRCEFKHIARKAREHEEDQELREQAEDDALDSEVGRMVALA